MDYYELANSPAWTVVILSAIALLAMGLPSRQDSIASRGPVWIPIATLGLLLPIVGVLSWPGRIAPLCLAVGLGLGMAPPRRRTAHRLAAATLLAGWILSAQGLVLGAYAAQTARQHDLPAVLGRLMAGLATAIGLDVSLDGSTLAIHSLRQIHSLALTWDLLFDPATACFLAGGLVLAAWHARRRTSGEDCWKAWIRAARLVTAVTFAWLPLRLALVLGVYVDRAARADAAQPLHIMNQFLSPWVALLLLIPVALLAWRAVFMPEPAAEEAKEPSPSSFTGGRMLVAVTSFGIAGGLITAAFVWQPVGPRREGRVLVVERHSRWEPTTRPYDTETFGGAEEDSSSYTYAAAYQYLGQFYEMSRLVETEKINATRLSQCDVLMIKVPTERYSAEEVETVVQFVREGGGLMLVGDHTNLERSSATMNDIARRLGFAFRNDVLYSSAAAPDEQHWRASRMPHPAVEHVGAMDFSVSCSIDPGVSQGHPVIVSGGLWSMPADYHYENFMPHARHCPEMRFGPFVQIWSARSGQGRVLAFADSTIPSNFCLYQPGRAELLLNMVEWLNRANPWLDPQWLLIALGCGAGVLGMWLVRRGPLGGQWLLLVAAAGCGGALGGELATAANRWNLPMPEAQRPLPRVVIDRTASEVPLAAGAYNEDKQGNGYGLLEQWIPRLGYTTVRASGEAALAGDALLIVCPSRPVTERFHQQLVEYVAGGGRVMILDSPENSRSTANSLLRPFGLAFLRQQSWQGSLALGDKWPWLSIVQAWEVVGGKPVGSLGHQRSIATTAQYGQGRVMAVGFGSLFNDTNMGSDWTHTPNATERTRYQTLFALVRLLVEDKPIAVPATGTSSAETASPAPMAAPGGRPRIRPRIPAGS